jgi:hypothetical protein
MVFRTKPDIAIDFVKAGSYDEKGCHIGKAEGVTWGRTKDFKIFTEKTVHTYEKVSQWYCLRSEHNVGRQCDDASDKYCIKHFEQLRFSGE